MIFTRLVIHNYKGNKNKWIIKDIESFFSFSKRIVFSERDWDTFSVAKIQKNKLNKFCERSFLNTINNCLLFNAAEEFIKKHHIRWVFPRFALSLQHKWHSSDNNYNSYTMIHANKEKEKEMKQYKAL